MSLTFAVEYGDRRHKALCAQLRQDGHSAVLTGNLSEPGLVRALLPGGGIVVAPRIEESARRLLEAEGFFCVEYLSREQCVLAHAIITAENAIQLAMQGLGKTLTQTRTLVFGYGRIGRHLCRMLRGLGANPAVTVRRAEDMADAKANGFTPIDAKAIGHDIHEFELIFNTVPALVLDEARLGRLRHEVIIYDLASKPGGVDYPAADRMGISVTHALALPGRLAPVSAATAIKETVYNVLTEEGII